MKRITHKCGCGAEASWKSDDSNWITLEALATNFMNIHAGCRQANAKEDWETLDPNPSPDPEKCAEGREKEVEANGCFQTESLAILFCQEKAKNDDAHVYHFYSCKVGGLEHWHVEAIEMISLVLSGWSHSYRALVKQARQQERERIKQIVIAKIKAYEYLLRNDLNRIQPDSAWQVKNMEGQRSAQSILEMIESEAE